MEIPDSSRVDRVTMARILDLSERQLTRLANDGVIPQSTKGKYDLAVAVQAYVHYVARGKVHSQVVDARTRLTEAQARTAEIEAERRANQLLDREDVQTVLNETMTIIATGMDSIGGRLASELAGDSDPASIRQKLLSETRRIRASAADKLARLGAIGDGGGDTAPTTRSKPRSVGKRKKGATPRKRGARAVSE